MRRLFSVALLLVICSKSAVAEKPNVVFILADDLGYGDLGCYGQSQLMTPNIDRFRAEGMKFTQHYAGDTVCAPSRCVLLTGLHTGHCRVRGNSPGTLLDEDVTLGEVMQSAGYETICIGKWGVGTPGLDDPNQQGFDQFFGYVSMWHAHNFYPEFLIRNGEKEPLRNVSQPRWKGSDGRGVAMKRVDYAPDLLTDEVLKTLDADRDRPFFLYYALNVPHTNNEGGRFNDRPEKGMEVPTLAAFDDRDWPGPEKGFATMIKNIDRDVGRIMSKLKERGLDENTIVIFTSDNGPHQEGGHKMEFFNSNGNLRGMKRDLYDGGVRVPFLVRWPGKIEAGSESDHLSGFQDVLPTLAEIAGAEIPSPIDGLSMLPTFIGKTDEQQKHPFLYWEFSEQGGKRGLRAGPWKLIQTGVSGPEAKPFELYNVEKDPSESKNLASILPGIVQRLQLLLDSAHSPNEGYPLYPHERKKN